MNIELEQLKIPGPTIISLTAPFWNAVSDGRLIVQFCEDCENSIFYPRIICPYCWGDRLIWRQSFGKGRLKSFSVVHKPAHPGWLPAVPYVVGLVELEEGPTMLSYIVVNSGEQCVVGQLLKFAPTKIGDRMLPTFKLLN